MRSTHSTIAVHGATGTQGGAVVAHLTEMGARVRALSRSGTEVPGAEAVAVDPTDAGALAAAYVGADAVVVSLPLEFRGDMARAHADAVLVALAKASVPRAVLLTNGPLATEPIGVPFVDVRRQLATDLPNAVSDPHVVGVAGIYLQNLTAPWSLPLLQRGVAAYPLPIEAPVSWLDVADLAGHVGTLAQHGGPALQVVTGRDVLTGDQLAEAVRPAFGAVEWRTITAAEYAAMLGPHLGQETAQGIASMYAAPPFPVVDTPLVPGRTAVAQWAEGLHEAHVGSGR